MLYMCLVVVVDVLHDSIGHTYYIYTNMFATILYIYLPVYTYLTLYSTIPYTITTGSVQAMESEVIRLVRRGEMDEALVLLIDANIKQAEDAG